MARSRDALPTRCFRVTSVVCSNALLAARRMRCGAPMPACAIRPELGQEASRRGQARVAPWRALPSCRLHRDQSVPECGTGYGLLQSVWPVASLIKGTPRRARGPPVDYVYKLQPRAWCIITPPRWWIFKPPLTRMPRIGQKNHWRHDDERRNPPQNRRQTFQQTGATSVRTPGRTRYRR